MFEFRDKKLGPLKFVSVSEARAKFADCLKEDDCNIVVTRHGVPYKVFVSYEDYLTLKNSGDDETAESGSIPAVSGVPLSEASSGSDNAFGSTWSEDKAKLSPNLAVAESD